MDWKSSGHPPLIIAHRGASFEAPENTLASFKLGLEQQCDAIECDIQLSADADLMVIHDPTTIRTTGTDRIVAEQTLADLKQLDAGSWKDPRFRCERIPTLQELFEILPADRRVFVELKSGTGTIEPLNQLLELGLVLPAQITLMAFELDTVNELRQRYSTLDVLWLYEFLPGHSSIGIRTVLKELITVAARSRFTGINVQDVPELDADFISACRTKQLKCYCWTVNDPQRAGYLFENGIKGIATDRPGWLREQIPVV